MAHISMYIYIYITPLYNPPLRSLDYGSYIYVYILSPLYNPPLGSLDYGSYIYVYEYVYIYITIYNPPYIIPFKEFRLWLMPSGNTATRASSRCLAEGLHFENQKMNH